MTACVKLRLVIHRWCLVQVLLQVQTNAAVAPCTVLRSRNGKRHRFHSTVKWLHARFGFRAPTWPKQPPYS